MIEKNKKSLLPDIGKAIQAGIVDSEKVEGEVKFENFFKSLDGVLSSTDRLKLWQQDLQQKFPGNRKINPSRAQCSQWLVEDLAEAIFLNEYSFEGQEIGKALINFSQRLDRGEEVDLVEVKNTAKEIYLYWGGEKMEEKLGNRNCLKRFDYWAQKISAEKIEMVAIDEPEFFRRITLERIGLGKLAIHVLAKMVLKYRLQAPKKDFLTRYINLPDSLHWYEVDGNGSELISKLDFFGKDSIGHYVRSALLPQNPKILVG